MTKEATEQLHELPKNWDFSTFPADEIYRFSHAPMSRLQKTSAIRTLKEDFFALSNRKLINWFKLCEYSLRDMAKEMNKLGKLNRNGSTWTFTTVRDLCLRLDEITEIAMKIEVASQTRLDGCPGEEDEVLDLLENDLFNFLICNHRDMRGELCGFPSLQ